ncbi:MAG TPA: PDR/VanB family oxidoreductase [Caldimonas sp.]|nr:PDR/VanB family oxidoreductase [Caldimonas sp.]
MNDPSATLLDVVCTAITPQARGISAFELRAPDGRELPAFTAGAHVDLHLPNGMNRSYSLCNSQEERHRYVVAVNKDAASRGGSRFIHEQVKLGHTLRISAPRNNFRLEEAAQHSVLIAGGIGITPLWCMVQRLERLGRSWELYYSTRVREMCAFRPELEALERARPGRVHLNFDQEPGGKPTDLNALVAGIRRGSHIYCCGPVPMLQAFEKAAALHGRPVGEVHVEYFSAAEQPARVGGFTVVLKSTGERLAIARGKTILMTLLENDHEVPYSCMEGVCGMCVTRVLEGIPDHRDSVLSPRERDEGKMTICCSGSKTPELVLDL